MLSALLIHVEICILVAEPGLIFFSAPATPLCTKKIGLEIKIIVFTQNSWQFDVRSWAYIYLPTFAFYN